MTYAEMEDCGGVNQKSTLHHNGVKCFFVKEAKAVVYFLGTIAVVTF